MPFQVILSATYSMLVLATIYLALKVVNSWIKQQEYEKRETKKAIQNLIDKEINLDEELFLLNTLINKVKNHQATVQCKNTFLYVLCDDKSYVYRATEGVVSKEFKFISVFKGKPGEYFWEHNDKKNISVEYFLPKNYKNKIEELYNSVNQLAILAKNHNNSFKTITEE